MNKRAPYFLKFDTGFKTRKCKMFKIIRRIHNTYMYYIHIILYTSHLIQETK